MAFGTIYAYQNNPRARVAQTVANYEGLELEWVETNPFAPNKSGFPEGYLQKYPLGLVPAFEKDGLELTESIAIANVAGYNNKAGLLGANKEDAARIQQWTLWANINLLPSLGAWFAPLLGRKPYTKAGAEQAKTALYKETDYLENYLKTRTYLVGDRISVADIFVASALTRGFEFVLDAEFREKNVNLTRFWKTIVHQPEFFKVLNNVEPVAVEKVIDPVQPKKEEKKPKSAPAPKPKAAKDEEEEPVEAAPKAKHPCEALGPAKSFPLDEFKRQYSNNETDVALKWLDANFDPQEYSLWKAEYKYPDELTQVFMSSNLITGFHSRLEGSRKYVFGSTGVYGENNNSKIVGVYMIRGSGCLRRRPDYESYSFTPLDFKAPADREFVEGCWAWTNEVDGLKYADGKVMK
ncbi:elongation factor 1-gamma 1 [Leucosporidium creatinivorum]|uniref:Elongation factor 1-gamma 1 n=1 Tax=Leucosporidium creatinivorum TaxID=106004 RepID=A0A1Y2FHT0_9BASI|nr:elongation factor 1-gamma 1 [Leucosporidium creatinivorum]